VVVEGFRPGVMDRLGVGATTLMQTNPRLVYCALTGYGQSGPLASAVGHDINYIGTVGLLDLNGAADGPPLVPGAQLADLSGAMVAALGILAALLRRANTGIGGMVDTSMAEAAFALISLPWAEWATEASGRTTEMVGRTAVRPTLRGQHKLSGGWACYNVYPASDGRYLALGALEPKFWAAFCQAVERPDWTERQFTAVGQAALIAEVRERLAERPSTHWLSLVQGRDVPLTLVNTLAEVLADPQLKARGVLLETVAGLTQRTPVRIDALPPAATGAPPTSGQHRAEDILAAWVESG
jgi:alpha-methylacyl-CoA racemase